MSTKYLNEAIIGNKNMIATYTGKGELLRMYFPTKDSKQYIDFFHTGVKINSSDLIYLHDDINNTYLQYYDTDTNVLNTEVTNTYFNLKIVQTDYCLINENVLAKKYIFLNEGSIDLDVEFYIHSQLLSDIMTLLPPPIDSDEIVTAASFVPYLISHSLFPESIIGISLNLLASSDWYLHMCDQSILSTIFQVVSQLDEEIISQNFYTER